MCECSLTLCRFQPRQSRSRRERRFSLFQPCRLYCYFNAKLTTQAAFCQPAGRSTYTAKPLKVIRISAAAAESVRRAQKDAAAHPRGSALFRCILSLIIQAEPIKTTIITVISPLFILMPFPISEVIMSNFYFARRIFLCWQRRDSERNFSKKKERWSFSPLFF